MPDDPTGVASRAEAWRRAHREEIDDGAALAFHVRAAWGLERALSRLDAAGVPALVVKGAILAHLLYRSPAERPIRDVDVRVRWRDLPRATAAILGEPGARLLVQSKIYRSAVFSIRGVEVDVEAVVGPPFVCAIGVGEMLERGVRAVEPLGFSHVRPEVHDHALVLAINAFKDHLLPTATSLEDLLRIVRQDGFDPGVFAARARDAGCRTLVHVVAQYIAEARGDGVWSAIAERIPPRRPAYARRVLARLRDERRPPEILVRLESRAMCDGRLRAAAAVATAAAREAILLTNDAMRRR
jgi:hypothetical protein